MADKFSCQVCEADALSVIDDYVRLPRVTSDCKPWPAGGKMAVCHACGAVQKLPDRTWFEEIGKIYGAYEIYSLSGGAEQVIFNGGGSATPRSRTLVDFVVGNLSPEANGKLIDIGCGNGAALGNFSAALPGWSLYGSELSDRALPYLRQLVNFKELFLAEPSEIPPGYDIVTMIHSLEHLPEPAKALQQVVGLLNPYGTLFVEIPDVETSPFDLIVADHLMHFSRATLSYMAERCGYSVRIVRNDLLPKEITLVAEKGPGSVRKPDPAEGIRCVETHVGWLRDTIAAAGRAAQGAVSYGIFGTSISGMWLYGAMPDSVAFFVDEDATRIGGEFRGRPIYAPADVPEGATVFVPLAPQVAEKVVARLSALPVNFVTPPAMLQ